MPGGLDSAFVCRAEDLAAGFRTNVVGPALVAQAFVALVARSGEKTVVNVSSTLGSIGTDSGQIAASYCVTKAALNMLVSSRWRASGCGARLTVLGPSTYRQSSRRRSVRTSLWWRCVRGTSRQVRARLPYLRSLRSVYPNRTRRR